MKIKKITSQHRRDFYAEIECESCGHVVKNWSGYDDHNYYVNVMPNLKCKSCDKSTNDLGIESEPIEPKYKPWEVV